MLTGVVVVKGCESTCLLWVAEAWTAAVSEVQKIGRSANEIARDVVGGR